MQMAPDGGDLYLDDVDLYKLLYPVNGQIRKLRSFWSDFEEISSLIKCLLISWIFWISDGDLNVSLMASNANDTGETS